ncbi:MAG: glycoside hydrolase family 38, partial [Opitutae bacterium]|nr:glycoside hydrolase family 38 [Opitutae bacterium]
MPNVKSRRAPTTATPIRNVHYVPSTHWDREWYQPFQDFRRRLVRLLDRTLADIASGTLRGPFTTDGQAILLEDYLEVRPERAAEVTGLVRTGKLKVGPWFVLPDEWLVSGEAIIRNLELGRAIVRRHGGVPSDAGFLCDIFGHVGQLPQIFAGFGINNALLWRGLEPRPDAHLWWEGSDGTRILCYRFPRTGYCDYAFDIRHVHQPAVAFDRARADKELDALLAKEAARSKTGPILLFDGGDHLEYELEYYQALFARRTGPDFPYRIIHSTLDEYLAEVMANAGAVKDRITGELRETAVHPCVVDQQWLIPGVLSSRVWIKQSNAACQALLCHWAEPFGAATAALCGKEYPAGFLAVAWRWLLMNHPHDSICGCSVDAVHEDMKYRFAQCEQIGELTTRESLQTLAASVTGELGAKDLRVLVANPLTRGLDETVELTLQLPGDWQCFNEFFGFEAKPGFRIYTAGAKPGFRIYTAGGDELPYQRIAQEMNRAKIRPYPAKFPQSYRTNDVTVAVRLTVPALGYTTLVVREGECAPKDEIVSAAMLPTRHPEIPGLAASERSLENEFLAVTIESNGTLTLRDKRSGESYARLLTFEDVADIGDGWYHGQAVNDQAFVSTGAQADVALICNGPLLTRFRVRTVLRVPAEFGFDRMIRSERMTDLVIDSLVTLRRGADRIEVRTTVQNNV